MLELFLHLKAGLLLNGAAFLQELNECARLTDVLEVSRNHRVEGLFHQFFDITKPLDNERGFLIINVDDHRKRQGRLERILGDERDFGQVLIKFVRANICTNPFQNEVGRGNRNDLTRICVECIFARQERLAPNTAMPLEASSPWR